MSFFKKVTITDGIPEVSPQETANAPKEVQLIDVRRPEEFNAELGHAPGAKLVTLESDFLKWLEGADPAKCYVFLCRSGGRSARATGFARAKGFAQTYNMEGGMIQWNNAGLAVERS